MEMHEELPSLEEAGVEQLYKPEELPSKDFTTASTIREKLGNESKLPPAKERAPIEEVTANANKKLEAIGVSWALRCARKDASAPLLFSITGWSTTALTTAV